MQTPKGEFDRRDFLRISTASTATAFGAFALAGNNAAMAATQASDSGSMKVAAASMTEDESPPCHASSRTGRSAVRSGARAGRLRRSEGRRDHHDLR